MANPGKNFRERDIMHDNKLIATKTQRLLGDLNEGVYKLGGQPGLLMLLKATTRARY